eukprot:1194619-Prorocentrum_minimum.AAC.3
MKLNADFPEQTRDLFYVQIGDGRWTLRARHQRFPAITRMYYVTPPHGRREVLPTVAVESRDGATCYADMRTVDGVVYDTFRQAALARGLPKGDDEWDRAMREAAHCWQVPSQLRGLFVSICVFCAPDVPPNVHGRRTELP